MTQAVLAEKLDVHLIISGLAMVNKAFYDLLTDSAAAVIRTDTNSAHNCSGKTV